MADSKNAREIFDFHIGAHYSTLDICQPSLLELGPGGSLITGVLARHIGFDKVYLVDVGDFAISEPAVYRNLMIELDHKDLDIFDRAILSGAKVTSALSEVGVVYLTDGIESLRQLPSQSVDFSFSNDVLEHVSYRDILGELVELHRLHRPGTITSHRIDYKDHLGGGLNHLRFSNRIWESRLFPNQGFYTNRLRHCDIKDIMFEAGFTILSENIESWDQLPLPINLLATEFLEYTLEELLVREACLVLRKS